jgi:biopolymer transport protein ExbB
MLKMTRLAMLAAALLLAAAPAVVPFAAQAQGQPATPATTSPEATPPAAAQPAAPAAPAAATGTKTTELVDNPYGLEALWKGGDIVAKVTLAILALMSMGSWYIIVTKVYEQWRMNRQAKDADRSFWNAPSVRQGAEKLKEGSPYRFIAESGLEATSKHVGLLGHVDLNTWISMSIQRAIDNIQARTQDGLAFLATVGSTAPFVALIMTAFGLAVAVPAVLGYNWLIRRNKAAMDMVRSFGADLHAVLLSAPKTAAPAPARA